MRRPSHELPGIPPHGFEVRRIRPEDLDEVMRVERLAFSHPWSLELFRRELDHDWSTVLLAEERGEDGEKTLLGFVIFWLVHDEVHVLNVAIDPTHRRKGAARALLLECLRSGQAHGAVLATLEVRKTNQAALALYESIGFRPVGLRKNYYVDENEDAVVMLLDL